ncbi:MAG TPA: alanine--tRNA ligase [Candidatus Polarisedimenticolia bacterium]|jgi:alanyl-tRNA synthetase|nr:alanine--tRNA ligase [Candidatus Polarisedimenticolia bacterium]
MTGRQEPWKGRDIRQGFLRFFEERGHQVVPSSSLVPANDPSLLFTNAGMNQFKEVFLGREKRPYRRACSSQKCLRVSGKHNDLEQVGRTPRHHTFFEMLGNFSFGDYFKSEAIPMAWELMTKVYGVDPAFLWITVFREDDEAYGIWTRDVGLAPARVLRMDEADNFWSMGETGPCGPCSEIHIDRGEKHGCGRADCGVGCSCDRFMELWNLVFMEFDRQKDGSLRPLAERGVDTGMGLERIAATLQDVDSNYDTDLLREILEEGARLLGVAPGAAPGSDVSLRVIADHVRAVTFLIADGVVPANDGRGYVLRRILRRAIRHGRMLERREPFLHRLTQKVVDLNAAAYPALVESREFVAQVCLREEERFASTLSVALNLFDELAAKFRQKGEKQVPGAEVFRLYDTFGLPLDLMVDEAESLGLSLDQAGFDEEMERQKTRARKSWKGGEAAPRAFREDLVGLAPTRFVGYAQLSADGCRVLALRREGETVDALRERETGEVLLDVSPFYAEAGGQVGDIGWLTGPEGRAEVLDCKLAAPGVRLHSVRLEAGALRTGDLLSAQVDALRRAEVARHHTATHLLHASLRDVLGTHVKQAGSLVAPDHLRFDFSHFAPVAPPLVTQVEDLVNEVILSDLPVTAEEMPLEEALATGAMALFGEKYGDRVRVIRIGDFSTELCGGTHTGTTGELGLFKVTGERGISSGVRRVEALSGEASLRRFREDAAILADLQQKFNVDRAALPEGVERLLQQNRTLAKELEKVKLQLATSGGTGEESLVREVRDVKVLPMYVEGLDKKALRELADRRRGQMGSGVVVLGTNPEPDRGMILVAVSRDLMGILDARAIAGELARGFDGRGGGRADLAEAGGRSTSEGIRQALSRTPDVVLRQMEAEK